MSKKQKKIEIEKYLPGLFARTEGYASNVSKYYTAAVNALLDLAADVDLEPDTVFYFADHKKLSVKATNVLRGLYSAVYQEIRRGVIAEWEFANLSSDAMIESIFGPGLKEDNHYARWFNRNHDAMDAFFKRKNEYGGLNLSQKVWKYTSQFKEEMELALSASLGRGDSAATVSRHVRQYLQEPDRLFRRVRDEEGNLQLSKRAAAYHPGRGEYRSSYRNAMRLARTETNMAYRAADNERWGQLDFVVGIEVKRSKRHFPCKICEALAGKFPKDFDFRGWHPQCRCYAVPILCSMDEMVAMQKRMLNGEDAGGFHSANEVREPHADFKKWVSENQERIEEARQRGTLPYWMKDNPKYTTATELSFASDKERFKAVRKAYRDEMLARDNVEIDSANIYTHHLFYGNNEKRTVLSHTFTQSELDAAKQLQDLLPTLKDGRYIPVDMSRPNYKEKMERFGIRNFVCYDVTINGDVFELKCSVRKDSGNHNRVKEFPYSFKKKKDK